MISNKKKHIYKVKHLGYTLYTKLNLHNDADLSLYDVS